MKGKKSNAKAQEPTKGRYIPPAPPLNSAYRSYVSKGHRGDPIQVDLADSMESDREWDDIEVEVRN